VTPSVIAHCQEARRDLLAESQKHSAARLLHTGGHSCEIDSIDKKSIQLTTREDDESDPCITESNVAQKFRSLIDDFRPKSLVDSGFLSDQSICPHKRVGTLHAT
jgi:hypothetical protein